MANILIFDPNSTPIPNRAIRFRPSVHTPDYAGLPNVLINPDMPPDVPIGMLKVVDGIPVELTPEDLVLIAQTQADATAAANVARVQAAKDFAKGVLDGDEGVEIFLKIMLEAIVDQLNVLRPYHSLADITPAQVKTVITNKINAL